MIDFPNSPTAGQTFTAAGKTWQWDGAAWIYVSATPAPTPTEWVRPAEWLPMPEVLPTEDKFAGLIAVYDTDWNYAELRGITADPDSLQEFFATQPAAADPRDVNWNLTVEPFELTTDFALECWFYKTPYRGVRLFDSGFPPVEASRLYALVYDNEAYIRVDSTTGGVITTDEVRVPISMAEDQWHHFALTRAGDTVRAFFNGLEVYEATSSDTFSAENGWSIGGVAESLSPFIFSSVRFVSGAAVYTEDFALPPKTLDKITGTVLLLNSDDPALLGVDQSDNQRAISLNFPYEDASALRQQSFLGSTPSGEYTVDWGDGTVEDFDYRVTAVHQYDYTNESLTDTSATLGYKQAMVVVTPKSGLTWTYFSLQEGAIPGDIYNTPTNWLDIDFSGPNVTTLKIGLED